LLIFLDLAARAMPISKRLKSLAAARFSLMAIFFAHALAPHETGSP
jgi:hypothetical protein